MDKRVVFFAILCLLVLLITFKTTEHWPGTPPPPPPPIDINLIAKDLDVLKKKCDNIILDDKGKIAQVKFSKDTSVAADYQGFQGITIYGNHGAYDRTKPSIALQITSALTQMKAQWSEAPKQAVRISQTGPGGNYKHFISTDTVPLD